MALALR
jgi:hypothetical protein